VLPRALHSPFVKTRTRAALALATTSVLLLGAVGPAHAAKHVRTDAAADVVRINPETDAQSGAPDVNQGDIRRFVVDHRAGNVFVTARFNDLSRGRQTHIHALQLLTSSLRRDVTIVVAPQTGWQGRAFFTDRTDNEQRCAHLTTRVAWDTNVVRVKVPRSCLAGPSWVRAGYGYFRVTPKEEVFADEAYRNGAVGDVKPQFGPRVHRG